MNNDSVLIVDKLSKKFCTDLKRIMVYGIQDVTRAWFGLRNNRGKLRKSEFWALDNISFELKRGETLGVIGKNGSGKSTLLRLLNGIYPPDLGRIEARGRMAALIAIGAGFHPHLTGRENIFLNGTILGLSRKEINNRLDEIIEFAGLGTFIDAPVATYSSGMNVRLGFSIAVHAPIEILLADEILAVGDLAFRVKCYEKIGELRKNGISTLFVSHDMTYISVLCNQVLLLEHGKAQYYGEVEKGVGIYLRDFMNASDSGGGFEKLVNGTEDFIIHSIAFEPEMKDDKVEMQTGQDLTLVVEYTAKCDFPDIGISFGFSPSFLAAQPFFFNQNQRMGQKINIEKGRGTLKIVANNISANNTKLFCNLSIMVDNNSEIVLWWRRLPVYVTGNPSSTGFVHWDVSYCVEGSRP
jgi:lipopolysaccharide transport system ATP-binding protein